MTPRELAAIVRGVVHEVKAYITEVLAPLETRTMALEQRAPRDGVDGRPGTDGRDGVNGRDGKDADPGQLLALQARIEALQTTLATRAIPTLEELRPLVEASVAQAVATLPTAKDGVNGRDGTAGTNGRDGVDGRDGKDGPTLDDLRPLVDAAVSLTVAQAVATMPKTKDGVSVTGALINRAGHLVLTRSEGAPIDVGLVTGATGPSGEPGRDGKDAAFKGAVILKCHDARTFEWCWSADGSPVEVRDAADKVIPSRFTLPIMLHKGTWSAGTYDAHDVVTQDGSQWMARTATTSRPGNGATDWVLIVKRGAQGPKGDPGPPGTPGRDLTQMDFEGRKW